MYPQMYPQGFRIHLDRWESYSTKTPVKHRIFACFLDASGFFWKLTWRPLLCAIRTHFRNDVLNLFKILPPSLG